MRISFHGVKKSSGSTILFSLGLIFAFSIVLISLVGWINSRYELVLKECESFYGNSYFVQGNEIKNETH